jgi:hypothetical protein
MILYCIPHHKKCSNEKEKEEMAWEDEVERQIEASEHPKEETAAAD